jgi:RNA polymerase sigma factor (sigma-70 family)
MNQDEYSRLLNKTRFVIGRLLMKNLPCCRERMIIWEDLWGLYLCKALEKIDYEKISNETQAIRYFKRQAKDAKYEYFRANIRKAKHLFSEIEIDKIDIPNSIKPVDEILEEHDVIAKIADNLSDNDVEFLNVCFLQDRSYSEVATLLNISPDNAKQKAHRLKKKLRKVYQNMKK